MKILILKLLQIIGRIDIIRHGLRVKFIRLLCKLFNIYQYQYKINYYSFNFLGNINNYIEWNIFFLGGYEKGELALYRKVLKNLYKDPLMLDIGSNNGSHSLYLSSYCNKIFSFEPDKKIYKLLIKNLQLNRIQNIKTFNLAISDFNKKNQIFYSSDDFNLGTGSLNKDHNLNNKKEILVSTVKGDQICNKVSKVDFIKIDVEGHELNVLEGLRLTMEKFTPTIAIEISNKSLKIIRNKLKLKLLIHEKYLIFKIMTNRNRLIFFNNPNYVLKKFDFEEDILMPEVNLLLFPKTFALEKLFHKE